MHCLSLSVFISPMMLGCFSWISTITQNLYIFEFKSITHFYHICEECNSLDIYLAGPPEVLCQHESAVLLIDLRFLCSAVHLSQDSIFIFVITIAATVGLSSAVLSV